MAEKSYKSLNDKLVVVIRIRGRVNVDHDIENTLERLKLNRVNNCTLIRANAAYLGMLNRCSDYVAFGMIDDETLAALFKKNGVDKDPKEATASLESMKQIRDSMPFRLHPPRHGFRKSIKKHATQKGVIGYVGEDINGLLKRML
ncbi:MAG: uL30 family ribosomal protein [Candidatus Marsarchaeota archaeon]|jgi:large subunit ribosomal protein L30|nr:uL30 family ribosomal protein [Candidatus Marsarchaeota archaeon]MCL5112502.1 uL30 family ribosomal protein [Candidatus Marsarchaeota archaeon]